ncbi:hypothetical protein KIN20_017488 [Parelaphostrongylus tenuis]|uniref:Uncharacterized protein n=1 Tax=Parelaphostrongylus tenuis TaxID=148309 RepID=A0AAD5MI07_PARTN|nr:hypothetical protein KIN20_017488 [Parelaphostrongylus tenuis]
MASVDFHVPLVKINGVFSSAQLPAEIISEAGKILVEQSPCNPKVDWLWRSTGHSLFLTNSVTVGFGPTNRDEYDNRSVTQVERLVRGHKSLASPRKKNGTSKTPRVNATYWTLFNLTWTTSSTRSQFGATLTIYSDEQS